MYAVRLRLPVLGSLDIISIALLEKKEISRQAGKHECRSEQLDYFLAPVLLAFSQFSVGREEGNQ